MKPLLFSILPRPPHPTRDGLAIRNYQLLKGLAGEFEVRAFALRAPGVESGEYPEGVERVEIPHAPRVWRQAAAAMESVLLRGVYSRSLYRSRGLARALREAALERPPVWTVAHSYHVGPFALDCGTRAWIDFHNVDSEIWARLGQTAARAKATAGFAASQAVRLRRWEGDLVRAATGISCVAERDAATLSGLQPRVAPLVVPNGVDLARYRFRAEPATAKRIFFVGDLSWPPNAQAVRWLQREIWPLIRRAHPEAEAEILGRGAPADLRRGRDASFRLLGEGGDTRPHWAKAAVGVVPLLTGSGTRLKILEAAASGVPVVATRVGAEGLELAPDREILLRDRAEDFASAVSELLREPALGARLARAARARVEALYDWNLITARFAAELARRTRS
jgi:glycosyltransferase involved in cell wall biosynthesis